MLTRQYGLPSHSMQIMLHAAVPSHQLKFSVTGAPKTVMLSAGLREDDDTVVIKAANYAAESQSVSVDLSGFPSVGTSGALTVLTSNQVQR
jgi:alpha-L-arabinofuranosidase